MGALAALATETDVEAEPVEEDGPKPRTLKCTKCGKEKSVEWKGTDPEPEVDPVDKDSEVDNKTPAFICDTCRAKKNCKWAGGISIVIGTLVAATAPVFALISTLTTLTGTADNVQNLLVNTSHNHFLSFTTWGIGMMIGGGILFAIGMAFC